MCMRLLVMLMLMMIVVTIYSRNVNKNKSAENAMFRCSISEVLMNFLSKINCQRCQNIFREQSLSSSDDDEDISVVRSNSWAFGDTSVVMNDLLFDLVCDIKIIFDILFDKLPHKEKILETFNSIVISTFQKSKFTYELQFFHVDEECLEHRKNFLTCLFEFFLKKALKDRIASEAVSRLSSRSTKKCQRLNTLLG